MAKLEHNVTKAELAQRVAEVGISRRYARQIVDFFFAQLVEALQHGEVIHMVGFGAFHFKMRPARVGRNPRTGVKVQVPAKRIIQFRPSRELKTLIRADVRKGTV